MRFPLSGTLAVTQTSLCMTSTLLLLPADVEAPSTSTEFQHPIPRLQRYYMVVMFCATAGLLYADQNLMAPNLTQIANDFGFDAEERDKYLGGYVAALFFFVGAPSALIVGYLSDTSNRRNLLFYVVLLGIRPFCSTKLASSAAQAWFQALYHRAFLCLVSLLCKSEP